MTSVYILAGVTFLLVLALLKAEVRKVELARKPWNELIAELRPIRTEGITLAALECSSVETTRSLIDPDEVWIMIGGWEGLRQIQANAQLLIALAAYARTWNVGGSANVADRMRCDAMAIRRAVVRIKLRQVFGTSRSSSALETACAYYRMSERLLTLYETSPSRRYDQLVRAVWPYPTVA